MLSDRADLHEAVRLAVDPMDAMKRVADQAMAAIDGAEGVLIGLAGGKDVFRFVCGAGYLRRWIGGELPLDGSLAGLAVRDGTTLRCDNAEEDPRANRELSKQYGIVSLLAVPLRRGGKVIGVLDVSSTRTHAFGDDDVATLSRLAEFASVVIGAAADLAGVTSRLLAPVRAEGWVARPREDDLAVEARFVANVLSPGALANLETRRQVARAIEGRQFAHHFQPIFDLWSGELFGFEALARFPAKPKRAPDEWFAQAHAVGLGVELEVASVHLALASLRSLPPGISLCVNAGPQALATDDLFRLLVESDPCRVVIELTEQIPVEDYSRLAGAIEALREMGTRLAIDDTGAGFASLAHILKLDPDLIKLDRALTTGIDRDPVRRALASALVTFAAQTRAKVIAEGIETPAELAMLQDLGIRYGQGYFLGRPRPAGSISWRPAHPIIAGALCELS